MFWKQRSRVLWLSEGDKNTKFFHSHASERRRVNKIKSLKNEDGRVVKSEREISRVATDYFSRLFMIQQQESEELLDELQPRVLDTSAVKEDASI